MAIDAKLLAIIVCPQCRGEIALNDTKDGLVCGACQLLYPIEADIPVMLIEAAKKL